MMRLRFLAISDTHLGEETSLLGFPHGLQHLWTVLRQTFGDNPETPIEVEDLVLVGDIPDRTLSSTAQISTATNAFSDTLLSALNFKRMIYVPGNHDHTLWSDYRRRLQMVEHVTDCTGQTILKAGQKDPRYGAAGAELLSIFFGYPFGSAWNSLSKRTFPVDFVIANPIYAAQFITRTYVFTHGTHFRWDVTHPKLYEKKGLIENSIIRSLIQRLTHLNIEVGEDPQAAIDLNDLEHRITPFVDSLWPSSKDDPTSRPDQLWYLLSALSGKLDNHRATPPKSELFTYEQLKKELPVVVRSLGKDTGSIARAIKILFEHGKMNKFLTASPNNLPTEHISFIYGDTHNGGFGEVEIDGRPIRIYNTGAWVVNNHGDHPPCHVFAVDEAGKEYLLDVSFQGIGAVELDSKATNPNHPDHEKTLLELAAQDAENRERPSGRLVNALIRLLPDPEKPRELDL